MAVLDRLGDKVPAIFTTGGGGAEISYTQVIEK
jgi:hypothetical protein